MIRTTRQRAEVQVNERTTTYQDPDHGLGNVATGNDLIYLGAYRRLAGSRNDIDEDVVVLDEPDLQGLVVVPCRHVGGLEELSDRGRARLLAALRRATRTVLEANPGSEATIVAMTDPPASNGHACFHVLPREAEDPGESPPPPG